MKAKEKPTDYWTVEKVEEDIMNYSQLYQMPLPELSRNAIEDYMNRIIIQVKTPEDRERLSELWKINRELSAGKNLERILKIMKVFTFDGDTRRAITPSEEKTIKKYINESAPSEMKPIYLTLLESHKKNNTKQSGK